MFTSSSRFLLVKFSVKSLHNGSNLTFRPVPIAMMILFCNPFKNLAQNERADVKRRKTREKKRDIGKYLYSRIYESTSYNCPRSSNSQVIRLLATKMLKNSYFFCLKRVWRKSALKTVFYAIFAHFYLFLDSRNFLSSVKFPLTYEDKIIEKLHQKNLPSRN